MKDKRTGEHTNTRARGQDNKSTRGQEKLTSKATGQENTFKITTKTVHMQGTSKRTRGQKNARNNNMYNARNIEQGDNIIR